MNNRKIKLALTVGLVNTDAQQGNAISFIKDLMLSFKEVGAYIGSKILDNLRLNPSHVKETYEIQFENCTLDVELVSNPLTKAQYVQGFQIR